jgi:hypothetical protein
MLMDLSSILSDFTSHLSGLFSNLRNTLHNNVSNALYDDLTISKKAAGARDIIDDIVKGLPAALNEYVTSQAGTVAGALTEAAATAVEDTLVNGSTASVAPSADPVAVPTPDTSVTPPAVVPTVSA